MATTKNIMMNKSSGNINKQLVFKTYGEKTVISKYPDMSRVKRSPEQKRFNDLMDAANRAVHKILYNDKLKMEAQVRLNVTSNKLYNALIKEYFQLHKNDKDPVKGMYSSEQAKKEIRKMKKGRNYKYN